MGKWLKLELQARNWSMSELARRSKLSHATVSNIVNGKRGISDLSLRSIAKALNMPPEQIYRIGGILPKARDASEEEEELLFLYNQLNDKDRQTILDMMNFLLSK